VSANGPPHLLEDINNFPVNEGTPVGNILFTVNATDPEGSPVHYGIVGTDRLGVDKDTGEVRVIHPLDREVSPSTIRCIGVMRYWKCIALPYGTFHCRLCVEDVSSISEIGRHERRGSTACSSVTILAELSWLIDLLLVSTRVV